VNPLKHNSPGEEDHKQTILFIDQFFNSMKTFFKIGIALTLLLTCSLAQSQVLQRPVVGGATVVKDSAIDATTKYITFTSTPNGVKGLSLSGVKSTGTVSAYAIVQVRTDTMPTAVTSSWIDYVYPGTTKRDTLFFTDITTVQGYQWPVPDQFFNGVRFKIVPTGTQKLYLYGSLLRR
jgi:hypothetical protein